MANIGFDATMGPASTITSGGTIPASASIRTVPFSFIGTLPSAQTYAIAITQTGTLVANGGTIASYIPTNPTATQTLAVKTEHAGTVTAQGTISISTSGVVTPPTFAAVPIAAGDAVLITNQATADATFANAAISLQFQVT